MSLRYRVGGVIGGLGGGWLRTFHHLAPDRKDPAKIQPRAGRLKIRLRPKRISPRGNSLRVIHPTASQQRRGYETAFLSVSVSFIKLSVRARDAIRRAGGQPRLGSRRQHKPDDGGRLQKNRAITMTHCNDIRVTTILEAVTDRFCW